MRGPDLKQRKCMHGHAIARRESPTHKSWRCMMARCLRKTHGNYRFYGARGITVCERWLDFRNFLEDVGERPSPDHTVDRINSAIGYEPGNVRWLTRSENSRRTRATHWLTIDGQTKTWPQWAEHFGIAVATVRRRVKHAGMGTVAAFTKPARSWKRKEASA